MTSRGRFCRYSLRTTDTDAARVFYLEALGLDLPHGERAGGSELEVWPLHEQARSRGAPAHWLGQIGVPDFDGTLARLVELGSEMLGPTARTADGAAFQSLRDPEGAVVALREGCPPPSSTRIRWHQLHTRDLERSCAIYSDLLGWRVTSTLDAPDLEGGHRMFAWDDAGDSVGSMANTARWPGVHAHWLFYFPVDDLDVALAEVRDKGGKALPPVSLPSGVRLAACDDPQGAAFGLLQPSRGR